MLLTDIADNLIKSMPNFYNPQNIRKPEFFDNFRGYRNGKLT